MNVSLKFSETCLCIFNDQIVRQQSKSKKIKLGQPNIIFPLEQLKIVLIINSNNIQLEALICKFKWDFHTIVNSTYDITMFRNIW